MKSIKKILAVIFVLSLVLCFAACDEKTEPSASPSASSTAADPNQSADPSQSLTPGQTAAPQESLAPGQTNATVNTYYSDVDEIIFGEYIAKGGSFELAILGDQGKLTYVQRDSEGSFTNISTLIITGKVTVTGNKVEFNSDIFTQGVTHATKWGIEGEMENYDELMQQFKGRLQAMGLTAQQIDDFCSGKELILTEAMGDFVDVCIEPFSYKSFKAEINGDGFAFTEMTAHSAYPDESNLSVTYYESGKVKELVAIDQEGAYKAVSTYGEDGLLLSSCYYVSDNKGGWVEFDDGQTEQVKPIEPTQPQDPSSDFDTPKDDEHTTGATDPNGSYTGGVSGSTVLKPDGSDVNYGDTVMDGSAGGTITIKPSTTIEEGNVVIRPIDPNATDDNYFEFGSDFIVSGDNFVASFGTLAPQG